MGRNDWIILGLLVLVIVGEIAGFAWVFSDERMPLAQRAWALLVLAGVAGVVWLFAQARGRRGRWEP